MNVYVTQRVQGLSPKIITEQLEKLKGYEEWNHDCTFEFSFAKTQLTKVKADLDEVLPFEVGVAGSVQGLSEKIPSFFSAAADHAQVLGEFGTFFFGINFERRDRRQTKQLPSMAYIISRQKSSELKVVFRGSQAEGVPDIALDAQKIIAESGIAVDETYKLSWDAIRCDLTSTSSRSIELLFDLVRNVGSGTIFEYFWDASIVDPEIANRHGFELYNRVAESGLTADEVTVLFKLMFMDMGGLDVVRQLCEGETRYTIPLGTFRHRNKKAMLGIFTNSEGHRLSLTLKHAPTEEEWKHFESVLGVGFDRKPVA